MSSEFDKLHDEVLINILVLMQRPFAVEMAPYRPVCRRWSQLSRTKDFWKAMCIKDMGPNISPIRLYQGATISTEARDYVIPIIKDGSKIAVDFMSYYRIRFVSRRQFISLIQWFNSVVNNKNKNTWQGKGTDLTLQNIKAFINIPWGNMNMKQSAAVAGLLFLIIPPLLAHDHKDLAYKAFDIIANRSAEDTNPYILAFARNCMRIQKVATEYKLPDLALKAFEVAGKKFQSFMETELLSELDAATVFDSIVTQTIRYGALSEANKDEVELGFNFKYPEEKYQVLYDEKLTIQYPEEYAIAHVYIARREFNLSNDWRVKAAALGTANALPSFTVEAAMQCVAFALEVLKNDNEHEEVKYAAMVLMSLITDQWHHDPKFLVPADQFVAIFQCFSKKLVEVRPSQVLEMLFIILNLNSIAIVSPNGIDEKSLDEFHDNLFKVLGRPDVVNKSISEPPQSIVTNLPVLAKTFGARLAKYLERYRKVLFTMAQTPELQFKGNLEPEELVATYVNLLCDVKEFESEAIQLVQQIENKSLGFTVRLPQFYGACGVSCSKLPGANVDHIITNIFGMLPEKFAAFGCTRPLGDFFKEIAEKLQEGGEEDEEDEDDCSDDEDDYDDDEPKERPDFLPFTEAQFMNAVEKSKSIPKNNGEFKACFQFSEPTPAKIGEHSEFVEKVDRKVDQGSNDAIEMFTESCIAALHTLMDLSKLRGEAYLPHAQKTFHYLLGLCRVHPYLHPNNLAELQVLFKMILPYSDGEQILHYSVIFLDILSGHITDDEKQPFDMKQVEAILGTFNTVIDALTPVLVPRRVILEVMDTLAALLDQLPLDNSPQPLEYRIYEIFATVCRKWPKHAIQAYSRSKICAWISNAIRGDEDDTPAHLAALLMSCQIGLRFGIAFMKMSLAIAPGSTIVRPYDYLEYLEQAWARFNSDGTLSGTSDVPPSNSRQLLQQTVLVFRGALIYDDLDMFSCYQRYTFNPVVVKDAMLSEDYEVDDELEELIGNVTNDNDYIELIFPKEFV